MKQKILKGLVVATLFLATGAYAGFTFYSDNPKACDNLPGHWSGTGKATNWIIGDCLYHGSGIISSLDHNGNFTVDVHSYKDSGHFICPSHNEKHLTGRCLNGIATINTDYGNVFGDFSQNSGTATGLLSVAPGVSVDVSMEFVRDN